MRHLTEYQQTKANALAQLREVAKDIKKEYPNDKPAQRMGINDTADAVGKDLPHSLTDAQRERITVALHNLACKLHP